jgi:hypothetical protein
MLVGLLPLLGYSQTIDTSNKNRLFPQRLQKPSHLYFRPMPDRYGFNHPKPIGPQLPIPDSIYMQHGKVVMIFDERKIIQFIQNRRRRWMNL